MKINLRDLFWLVAVAALLVAWWLTYRRMDSEQARLLIQNAELKQLAADRDAELKSVALQLVQPTLIRRQGSVQINTIARPERISEQGVPWSIDQGMLFDAAQGQKRFRGSATPPQDFRRASP